MNEEQWDFHVEATVAGVDAVEAALRDPTEHDIPRDERGSFVERLGSVKEMVWKLHGQAATHGYNNWADALKMIADKLDAIATDIALAEGKGESDA